jgi:hypothetical protein
MGSFSGRLRQQSGLVPAATSARHGRFHVLSLRMGTLRLLAVVVGFVVPQAFGVVSDAKPG